MATSAVKEAVKEAVLGSDEATTGPSQQSKARFTRMAVKDENGELYMGPEEFINAVAPQEEDFVSSFTLSSLPPRSLVTTIASSRCPTGHAVCLPFAAGAAQWVA